jgi:hypothetical protein
MPLWLGAEAARRGLDPNDAATAARIFAEDNLRLRVGGFFSYYPPTAALALLPARMAGADFETVAQAFRGVQVTALILGAIASAEAGFVAAKSPLGKGFRVALAAAGAALWFATRPARIVLPSGQPGPLVVACTAIAIWAFASRKGSVAGVWAGVGAALKLFPLVLAPAWIASRALRPLLTAFGVVAMAFVGLGALGVPLSPVSWTVEVLHFVDKPTLDAWTLHEPAWLLSLWRVRLWLGCAGLAACTLYGALRGTSHVAAVDLSMLGVATGGLAMSGSHHYHEALVVLPALAHALLWPAVAPRSVGAWSGSLAVVSALVIGRGTSRFVPPDSLHWVAMSATIWAVCLWRTAASLRDRR